MSGPDWYYSIPEARRLRYEREREIERAQWWAKRVTSPARAEIHKARMDELAQELAREFPPITTQKGQS